MQQEQCWAPGCVIANADTTKDLGLVHKDQLTVGLEGTYAPYSYRAKNGNLEGIDVDMAKAIGKKMGLKVVFVPTKWDSLVEGLRANKYDIILNDMAPN